MPVIQTTGTSRFSSFWADLRVFLPAVAVLFGLTGSGFAAETWTVIVQGQAAGNADRSMLLFGEIQDAEGQQIGSYFERFEPTKMDPKTGAPLAGKGQSVFRVPGGTIVSVNTSRVVGPGTPPKTMKVETQGRIVNGTGEFTGLSGTFHSQSVVSPLFDFSATVTFSTTGGKTKVRPVATVVGPTCTSPVIPASCCRPTYSCCRVPVCVPARICLPVRIRRIKCR